MRRAWDRLIHDFPISIFTQHKLLPLAFESDARNEYEEVTNSFIGASIGMLLELLERRLCNEVHQAALQDNLFQIKWNGKRESFTAYAQRLCSASLALPKGIPEDFLINRLIAGIPLRLRDQAHLVIGTHYKAERRLGHLSTAQVVRETGREMSGDTPRSVLAVDGIRYAIYLCHFCGIRGHNVWDCVKKKTLGIRTRDLSPHQEADPTKR